MKDKIIKILHDAEVLDRYYEDDVFDKAIEDILELFTIKTISTTHENATRQYIKIMPQGILDETKDT